VRIGSLVEGKVVTVATEVGNRVTAGATLAELHSQVVHVTWAEYRKAIADRKRQETQFAYTVQEEVQRAQVDRVVAEQSLEMAKTEVRRTEEALEHLGITSGEDPSGEKGEQIPVKSPIAGAVLEKSVTTGTAVTPGMPLFVVSDLSTLWALAEVDETQLSLLQVGRPVAVRVAAYPSEVFPGTIIFIADFLDPKTRRVSVRCRVANPHGKLKPHMYATLMLGAGETRTVVAIPAPAVQAMDGKTVVFVADDTGKFALREVTVGTETEGWVEVITGIRPGERVAASGSFLLKSELLKATVTED
jgi:cobalt-zinc-cadmium efflux system membrane fusion protein